MKISIVTAAWNSAATLGDTIESVIGQTHTDWEHIIVDGGSTDSTRELVESFRDRYKGRLVFSSEPDKGIYDAMNKGIARATGDVVGFLNSDDFFTSPTVLARIAEAFTKAGNKPENDPENDPENNPENSAMEGVYGDIMYVDAEDTQRVVRYYSSEAFRRWKMRLGFMPAHPSFYCRREVYDRCGCFDTSFRIAADFENLLRIIYVHGTPVTYLPMNFVTMRIGGASTSGLASHKRIIKDHVRAYRKNGVPSGLLLDLLRYPYKVMELISFRLHNHNSVPFASKTKTKL